MTNSASDGSRGPDLMSAVTLLPRPSVAIAANGYMQVLGISESATLMITNSKYEFMISGNMLNLIQADLTLSAAYGDLSRASFNVHGRFRNDLYATIENEIKKVLKEASGIATEEINEAQRKLDGEQAKFDDAIRKLQSAQRDVDSANADFNAAERKLKDAQNHAASVCTLKTCRQDCVPCPDGFECCGRILGTCVCERPRINPCCTRIPDPVCEGENTACRGLRATAEGAVIAAEGTVSTTQKSVDAAEAALQTAQGAVNVARGALNDAKEVLKATSETFKVGSDVANKIARFGVNGLISIREISFDASLGVASGGSFSGSVRASFLGQAEVTVSLKIDMRDITSMARQLADEIGNAFSSLF